MTKYNYTTLQPYLESAGITLDMLNEIVEKPKSDSRMAKENYYYDLYRICKGYCSFLEEMKENTLSDAEWLVKNTIIKYDYRDVDIQRILGISRSKLSNWLNGYTPISTFEKFKIRRTIDYYSFLGFTKMKNEEFKNKLIHYMNLFICTQEEIEKRTGIRQETISLICRGKRPCNIEEQYKLLKAIYDMANSFHVIKDRNREEFDILGSILYLESTYNQPEEYEFENMEWYNCLGEVSWSDEELNYFSDLNSDYERDLCELERYLLTLPSKTQDIFIENLEAFIYDCLDDGVVIVLDPDIVNNCVIDYRKKTDEEKELFIKEKEKLVSEKYENNYHTTKLFDICTSYRNIIKNVKKYGVLADICDEVISEKQAQRKIRIMEEKITELSPSYNDSIIIDVEIIRQQLSYTLDEWYVAFLCFLEYLCS